MMGYVFLAFALLAGATNGFCGKKTSGYLAGMRGAMMANLIRMGLCVIIGLILVTVSGNTAQLCPDGTLLWIAALSGVSTAIFVVTWLVAVKQSAYMLLEVFLTLGTLVPLVSSLFLFGESIRLTQWFGLALLVAAVLILCSYNNGIKGKLTLSGLLLLVAAGVFSGLSDLSQKLFVKTLPDVPSSVFNLYTYVFSGITLAVLFLLMGRKEPLPSKQNFLRVAGYVTIMAACLFAYSFLKTLAANHLDSVLLYPLTQGAGMILSTVMSAIFFKEKLTAKCVVGVALSFVALLIINVL